MKNNNVGSFSNGTKEDKDDGHNILCEFSTDGEKVLSNFENRKINQ